MVPMIALISSATGTREVCLLEYRSDSSSGRIGLRATMAVLSAWGLPTACQEAVVAPIPVGLLRSRPAAADRSTRSRRTFSRHSQDSLDAAARKFSSRGRQRLDWITPCEVFANTVGFPLLSLQPRSPSASRTIPG